MIILSMHLLPRKNYVLDFIRIGSLELLGALGEQKQIQNEKLLPILGLELTNLRFVVKPSPTELAGIDENSFK